MLVRLTTCRLDPPIIDRKKRRASTRGDLAFPGCRSILQRLIEPFTHRIVLRQVRVAITDGVLSQESLWRIVRLMRKHRRVPEKEGLFALRSMKSAIGCIVFRRSPAQHPRADHPETSLGEACVGVVTFPVFSRLKAGNPASPRSRGIVGTDRMKGCMLVGRCHRADRCSRSYAHGRNDR